MASYPKSSPNLVHIYVKVSDYFRYITLRGTCKSGSALMTVLLDAYEAQHGLLVPKLTETQEDELHALRKALQAIRDEQEAIPVQEIPITPPVLPTAITECQHPAEAYKPMCEEAVREVEDIEDEATIHIVETL